MADHRYLIALGSNRRHHRHGNPRGVVRAALAQFESDDLGLGIAARTQASRPLGPSRRAYANTVALVWSRLPPDQLLVRLKQMERKFGRRPGGQRWGARVLDLDIVLWNGGCWKSPGLTIPHVAFRQRSFVLGPALTIAPLWRDPITGLTLRHLAARLTKPRRAPR